MSAPTLREGSFFSSREELRKQLKILSSQEGFRFVTAKSGGRRYLVVCKEKEKSGCKWRLYAKADNVVDRWEVKAFQNQHTCEHQAPKERVVGKDEIKDLIRDQVFKDPSCSARKLINDLEKVFDGKISYHACFRAKEECLKEIYGTSRGVFSYLKKFLGVLEVKNPGTVTEFVDPHHCFARCFVALGCSIHAVRFLRPLIGIYRMDMQSSFKGVMVCAVGFDALGALVPLAYSYMEAESGANWKSFLTSFKAAFQDVLPPLENLTFISERKSAIVESVDSIFPASHHGLCLAYLIEALENQLQGSNVGGLVLKLAASKRESEYLANLEEIRQTSQLAYDYLIKLDKSIFVDCFFSGKRFGIYSSVVRDSAESRNYVQRDLTPFLCFESLVRRIGELFFRRKQEFAHLSTVLPPALDEKCKADLDHCRKNFQIHQMGQSLFDMVGSSKNYVVDLNHNTCSCCLFQDHLFPCVHSSMPIFASGKNFEDFASPYYHSSSLMSTYEGGVIMVARDDCGVDERSLNVPFSLAIKSEAVTLEEKPLSLPSLQGSDSLALIQSDGRMASKNVKVEASPHVSAFQHTLSVPVHVDLSPISNTAKSLSFQTPAHTPTTTLHSHSQTPSIRSDHSLKSSSEVTAEGMNSKATFSPHGFSYGYSSPSPSAASASTHASASIPTPSTLSISSATAIPASAPSSLLSRSDPLATQTVPVPVSMSHPNTVLSIKEITAPSPHSLQSKLDGGEQSNPQKYNNVLATTQDSLHLKPSTNASSHLISVPIVSTNFDYPPQSEPLLGKHGTLSGTTSESENEQNISGSFPMSHTANPLDPPPDPNSCLVVPVTDGVVATDPSLERERPTEGGNAMETNGLTADTSSHIILRNENGSATTYVGNAGLKAEKQENNLQQGVHRDGALGVGGRNKASQGGVAPAASDEPSALLNADLHLIKGLVFSSAKGRKRELRCSKCNNTGHNKRSCPNS